MTDALTAVKHKALMVVESRTKAKEISSFLDGKWTVLPTNGFLEEITQPKDVAKSKKAEYGRYGIRLSDFDESLSFVPRGAATFSTIRAALKGADLLVVSTDPDRAGDAIGLQLVSLLDKDIRGNNVTVLRASWHEITRKAVMDGLHNAQPVKAMQPGAQADRARAAYDRLFGYSVSPYLWRTVGSGTSGGRAQSPALRLVVGRERERMAFTSAPYYGIEGVFTSGKTTYEATLASINGEKLARSSSFGPDGKPENGVIVLDSGQAEAHAKTMRKASWHVSDVKAKAYRRVPPRPYKTSTLQQDVGTRLGMSSSAIMRIAQKLFENAIITYLRTDAEVMSEEGVKASRTLAVKLYGKGSVPASPRVYRAKSNAQEGHEAIRPVADEKTGLFPSPQSLRPRLQRIDPKAYKVYDLIYRRSIASQMNDATGTTIAVSTMSDQGGYLMTSSGTTLSDPGWTRAMSDTTMKPAPDVRKGNRAKAESMKPVRHETKPPARFTEPQLVARLEELGIGRPATYAQIVEVNQKRGYVAKKGQALYPTWRGMQVAAILEAKMPAFVDYGYTASMEEKLDEIQDGILSRTDFLKARWDEIDQGVNGLASGIDWDEINRISTISLGHGYLVRCTRNGAWLERADAKPDDDGHIPAVRLEGDELYEGMDESRCEEIMSHVSTFRPRPLGALESGPYKGYEVTIMEGRYGAYAHAQPPRNSKGKPVNITLGEDDDKELIDKTRAEEMFAQVKLPRQLGEGYFTGIGKRGAWIGHSKGASKRSRAVFVSAPENMDPRTVTLEEAKTAFAEELAKHPRKPARRTSRGTRTGTQSRR